MTVRLDAPYELDDAGSRPSDPAAIDSRDISYAVQRLSSEDAFALLVAPLAFDPDGTLVIGMLDEYDEDTVLQVKDRTKLARVRAVASTRAEILAQLAELYPRDRRESLPVSEDATGIEYWDEVQRITLRRHAQNLIIEPIDEDGNGVARWYVDGIYDDILEAVDYGDHVRRRDIRDVCAVRFAAEPFRMLCRRVEAVASIRDGADSDLSNTVLRRDAATVDARVLRYQTALGYVFFIRVLGSQQTLRPVRDLGMPPDIERKWRAAIHSPSGFHCVVGPPGVGKNTSAIAPIAELRSSQRNDVTMEKPIEIRLTNGVKQIELSPSDDPVQKFETLLSAQPTMLYVSETRDERMGRAMFTAARIGFNLVTTFHARDTLSAVARLSEDFGIPLTSVCNNITTILSQRLVQRLCACARSGATLPDDLREIVALTYPALVRAEIEGRLREPVGCAVCNGRGYNDLIGVFELVTMTSELRVAMMSGKPVHEIEAVARAQGFRPMIEAAWDHVIAGTVAASSVIAVLPPTSAAAPAQRQRRFRKGRVLRRSLISGGVS